jgi:FKBP-type peptidyl-prolyl cis-trans isomerase SlyD|tara:strand:+ start:4225 stop:4935 length:711 start_codon:yes stop_codon:yes gene_type:complete
MVLKKKDFIEIEFTGMVKEGDVFDSNIKEDLEKINSESTSNSQAQAKPFIFSLGEGMFLKGVEDFLEGKEVGKYKIELAPENAFGNRESKLIKLIPSSAFRKENINPMKGMMFNFDGQIGKVISVSGGRVNIDFNNPIAGKNVVYDVNVLRKVEELNEKAKALVNFLFRRDLDFEIEDKKINLKIEEKFKQFAELFKDKFKEILDLDLVVESIKEEEKKKEKGKEEEEENTKEESQ